MKLDKIDSEIPTDIRIQEYTFQDARYTVHLRAGFVKYEREARVCAGLWIDPHCADYVIEMETTNPPPQVQHLFRGVMGFNHFRAERAQTLKRLQKLAKENRLCELIPEHFYHIN